ncbi:MAG TPA: type II secretion system F family protein [Terriglobales bacterium]|nr:type II secretion system F family protein [Terriglobales bacterium]
MAAVLLFILLLITSFGVLLYFLKPTKIEAAVEQHLTSIEDSRGLGVNPDGTTILKQDPLSSNPAVDSLIRHLPGVLGLAQLIKQAGQTWQVGSVLLASVIALVVGSWIASFFMPSNILSVLVGVLLAVSPIFYLYILRETRFRRCDALVPEAVDLMARGLRAGHAVPAVLEMVGKEIAEPLASEFRALAEEQTLGLPLRDAMLNLVERVPRADIRFLATAILLQKETGGNLAQILDKTAALARERSRLRGQLRIYTAQGRITGWILCIAPFIMFGVISLVNWNYEKILFTDPSGLHVIYFGMVMMVIGILVIRKVINIKI